MQESFVFLDDINERGPPASNGKRICLAPAEDANQPPKARDAAIAAAEGRALSYICLRLTSVTAEIAIKHSPHERNIVYLLYPREIITLDLTADQVRKWLHGL